MFDSVELSEDMQDGQLDDFFLVLAVCHTIIVTQSGGAGGEPRREDYQGESPDELALVFGACDAGFTFLNRAQNTVHVTISRNGEEKEHKQFEILAINQFSSLRKRMSVVVRTPSGSIELLCKGADNVMHQISAHPSNQLAEHLREFACEGLRTLVMGKRVLAPEEWQRWSSQLKQANLALQGRKEQLFALAAEIERDLDILGATAIEDKLQEDVPSTIADLGAAGIKLWVLTGDKLETAVSIGFSANVLNQSMTIHQIDLKDTDSPINEQFKDVSSQIQTLHERLCPQNGSTRSDGAAAASEGDEEATDDDGGGTHALVITGPALSYILNSQVLKQTLLDVGIKCAVVLACRTSPAQKALLVKLVQLGVKPRPVTLAIGDGANDVPMLQQAQVWCRWGERPALHCIGVTLTTERISRIHNFSLAYHSLLGWRRHQRQGRQPSIELERFFICQI